MSSVSLESVLERIRDQDQALASPTSLASVALRTASGPGGARAVRVVTADPWTRRINLGRNLTDLPGTQFYW
jgi:hypothetical protein